MGTDSADIPETLDISSPLWAFALTLWQKTGVEPLCLALQDQGWSVTRLLCACWLTSQGKVFSSESLTVIQWRQQMTEVLRALKKSLPKDHDALAKLRAQLASTELEAERVELALAWQTINSEQAPDIEVKKPMTLALQNIYAAAPGADINPEASKLINQLAALALPDSPIPNTDR